MLVFIVSADMSSAVLSRVHFMVMTCVRRGPFSYQNGVQKAEQGLGLRLLLRQAVLFPGHPEMTSFSCGEHRLQFVKNRNVAEGIFF